MKNQFNRSEDSKKWTDIWNEQHVKHIAVEFEDAIEGLSKCGNFRTFKPRPEKVGYRNKKMIEFCERIMTLANKMYRTGEPIMADTTYDEMEDRLATLDPKNKLLEIVG